MVNEISEAKRGYTPQEAELIKQLVQSRLSRSEKLEYEDLNGYELPPRTQFSMLSKPAVTIKYGKLKFNTAAIRMFEGVKHILTPADKNKKRLAVIPCKEEESASVEWARKNKDDKWVTKEISSIEYIEKIFELMKWDRNCRYKILGKIVNSSRGLILRFDLVEAIMFDGSTKEYKDPKTGKIKKKQIIYFPDMYKDRIGKSYSDYMAEQTSLFDDMSGYSGNLDITEENQQPAPQESGGVNNE